MNIYEEPEPINLGMGSDVSIAELSRMIKEIVGFQGEIAFDSSRPDGMPVKLLDSNKLGTLGWKPRTSFRAALEETYRWFLQEEEKQGRGERPEVQGKNKVPMKGQLVTIR
jgi:GDP-L-fucose synthase